MFRLQPACMPGCSEKTVDDINSIVNENPNKNINKTAFSYAYRRHDDALNEAYGNFIKSEVFNCENVKNYFDSQ